MDSIWIQLKRYFSDQLHLLVRDCDHNSFELLPIEGTSNKVYVDVHDGKLLVYKADQRLNWQVESRIYDHIRFFLGDIETLKYATLSLFFDQESTILGYEYRGNLIIPLLRAYRPSMESSNIKSNHTDRRLSNTAFKLDALESMFSTIYGGIIRQNIGTHGYRYVNRENVNIEGFGFEPDLQLSKRKALFEYIERLCSSIKPFDYLLQSYSEIQERAVHPTLFGTYPDGVLSENRLKRFTDNLVLEWTLAESAFHSKEVYIPLQVTHYLVKNLLNKYIFENSNGCALGNSLIESRLYGLLEVIERESFLHCWYTKGGFVELDLDVFECSYFKAFQEIFLFEGYRLHVYMLENKFNIPVVWAFLENIDQKGFFYSITALGANVEIYSAVRTALHELHLSFIGLMDNQEAGTRRIKELESHPTIQNVEDHIYFFASNRVKPIFNEIKRRAKKIKPMDVFKNDFSHINVTVEYEYVIQKIKNTGAYMDLLFSDLTLEEMRPFSLYCSKAILLGAIPLDFTQKYVRISPLIEDYLPYQLRRENVHPLA